jgi:hypothetical protein
MAQFDAVSKGSHTGRSWQRYNGYEFARARAVVPLFSTEMDKAALAFPTAFLAEGEGFMLVALMSLDNERNLFVASDGRWLASYIPAALRGHPFALLDDQKGDKVLCIDETSGLLLEDTSGESFFDDAGEITEPIRKVMEFLTVIEAHRTATARACAALSEAELIVPWDITLKTDNGEQKIEGLHKIDEVKLASLPAATFEGLRQAGAVPLAYYQTLSIQNLPTLGRLAEAHAAQRQDAEAVLHDIFRPSQVDEIDIDWSAFADESPEEEVK